MGRLVNTRHIFYGCLVAISVVFTLEYYTMHFHRGIATRFQVDSLGIAIEKYLSEKTNTNGLDLNKLSLKITGTEKTNNPNNRQYYVPGRYETNDNRDIIDEWGNVIRFVFVSNGNSIMIQSYGPNKKDDNGLYDDIIKIVKLHKL